MKKASIRILNSLWQKVRKETLSSRAKESAAFVTAKYFETSDKIVFLAENIVPAKAKDYLYRGEYHLEVSPLYVNRVLNVAEYLKNTVIMVHSHPFENGIPNYSISDDTGEKMTSETISKCLDGNPPVGSILLSQTSVSARGWLGLSKECIPASLNILNQNTFHLYDYSSRIDLVTSPLVDRQVRALGASAQIQLESLEIGIVGLGGTGSAIAEQLVRMGIKKLQIVDHDKFEPSNWSRFYGSTWKDTLKTNYKVDIIHSHLREINPNIDLKKIKKSVMTKEALKSLSNCDIIFSCLDRHAPRAVLNELSYQCFIPLIDVGVGLVKDHKNIIGGTARATVVGPELPCLLCQEIVRPDIITAEHLFPAEYESRRAEGYVNNLDQTVPSVISYTTLASSLGLMLFLDLISSQGSDSYSTLFFDLHSKETMRLRSSIKEDCICQKRLGKGFSIPFSVAD